VPAGTVAPAGTAEAGASCVDTKKLPKRTLIKS
jgi:hypothetical protein